MKVSMDPGFEYTSLRRERLQPLIAYADYVFLNKSEKKNLGFNARSARPLYANLCEYFSAINPDPTRTLIVKHDDRHELIHFKDGVCADPHSPPQKALPVPVKQRYRRR